ncbi:MAG: polyprenyl synthetase family protein [Bacteroidota bacterium]
MFSFEKLQEIINNELVAQTNELTGQKPGGLYQPVKYSLEMGGKRLRPVLLLMANNMFTDEINDALPAAVAVEIFHNFTLLHDDIMDNAEVRRNNPTVHMQFSENNAILSGDAMAFLSYRYLLKCNSTRLFDVVQLFTNTALEVCEGQQYDMDFEDRRDVSEQEYIEMIRLKTAVLIASSLKAGAILAGAGNEISSSIYDFGLNLGLAFQLQDDLLDTFGNQDTFGKKIGGDILANKKTYLLIKALENASDDQREKLEKWMEPKEFDPNEKIEAVSDIFNQLKVKDLTERKIDSYFTLASDILDAMPVERKRKQPLKELSNKMLGRNH